MDESNTSLNGGDKGGSSIVHKANAREINEDSNYDSALIPRKLNLKIHTNIDDNFEIHSSEQSSIISHLYEDVAPSDQFQATGETCVIVCDDHETGEKVIDEGAYEFDHIFRRSKSKISQDFEENTMIVHKNVPSNEMILNFQSKLEDSESDSKKFKRKREEGREMKTQVHLNHEIINEPMGNANQFRRVESTSSFKRLPKLTGTYEPSPEENAEMSIEKSFNINSSKNHIEKDKSTTSKHSFYNHNYQQ